MKTLIEDNKITIEGTPEEIRQVQKKLAQDELSDAALLLQSIRDLVDGLEKSRPVNPIWIYPYWQQPWYVPTPAPVFPQPWSGTPIITCSDGPQPLTGTSVSGIATTSNIGVVSGGNFKISATSNAIN
jgi:hypothetical protein